MRLNEAAALSLPSNKHPLFSVLLLRAHHLSSSLPASLRRMSASLSDVFNFWMTALHTQQAQSFPVGLHNPSPPRFRRRCGFYPPGFSAARREGGDGGSGDGRMKREFSSGSLAFQAQRRSRETPSSFR